MKRILDHVLQDWYYMYAWNEERGEHSWQERTRVVSLAKDRGSRLYKRKPYYANPDLEPVKASSHRLTLKMLEDAGIDLTDPKYRYDDKDNLFKALVLEDYYHAMKAQGATDEAALFFMVELSVKKVRVKEVDSVEAMARVLKTPSRELKRPPTWVNQWSVDDQINYNLYQISAVPVTPERIMKSVELLEQSKIYSTDYLTQSLEMMLSTIEEPEDEGEANSGKIQTVLPQNTLYLKILPYLKDWHYYSGKWNKTSFPGTTIPILNFIRNNVNPEVAAVTEKKVRVTAGLNFLVKRGSKYYWNYPLILETIFLETGQLFYRGNLDLPKIPANPQPRGEYKIGLDDATTLMI